ncbi:AAA family ATPase [Candidatus Gracilibacteria bacterium]|nr:AAA family ATPase [Candidatus Gracilibacteria bacterium]
MLEELLKQDSYIVSKYNFKKYIERDIYSSFDSNSKIYGIIGLRGVGKTSYLLSRRVKTDKSIYISCDLVGLKNVNLFNILDELQKNYGYTTFYLDEIHFNQDWQQSLKNIYDFLDVKVIFSGSNMINLTKGGYDLSRRSLKFELKEFSFREFIYLTKNIKISDYSLDDILNNHVEIAKNNISWFSKKMLDDYLRFGQFGYFYEEIGNEIEYKIKMQNSIKKSIYEDLTDFVDISTNNLSKIEDIIYYIANAGTSDLSVYAISKKITLSPQVTEIYINFLSQIGLVNLLQYFGKTSDRLRKSKKFYLANTNILSLFDSYTGNFRETFFVSQIKRLNKEIFFMTNTDFVVKHNLSNLYFEIGGKNKKRSEKDIFIIKDDIEIGIKNEIPLRLFGLINKI